MTTNIELARKCEQAAHHLTFPFMVPTAEDQRQAASLLEQVAKLLLEREVAGQAATKVLDELKSSLEFYRRRVELLQRWQSRMRDPERTMACDIIANGQMLPDVDGSRYGVPAGIQALTELQRTHIEQAIAYLEEYEPIQRKAGNDSGAEGSKATAFVLRQIHEAARGVVAQKPESRAPIDRDSLVQLIADQLSGTYHCTRTWQAWGVGTMSQDDFSDVGESDTPGELADAILEAMRQKGAA